MTDADFLAWLQSGARRVILIEAQYHDGAGVHTVYLSQGDYTTAPGDSPANQPYEDVATAPDFSARLADSLSGVAQPSWGDIDILSPAGERHPWLAWSWGRRPLLMRIGAPDWPFADFRVFFNGLVDDITAKSPTQIALKIRDKQALFNTPVSTRTVGEPEWVSGLTYRVAEGAVDSIDAVEDDGAAVAFTPNTSLGQFTLAAVPVGRLTAYVTGGEATRGALVPIALGEVFNVPALLLDGGLQRHRVADGPIQAITAVRDQGIATTITADLSRGVFDVTAAMLGSISADVQGSTVGGVWLKTLPELLERLLTHYGAASPADLDAASFTALASACPQTLGLYLTERSNLLDACDQLLQSLGAWLWPDRTGHLRVGRVDAPGGTPRLSIGPDDLDAGRDIRLLRRVLPAASVTLKYQENHAPQTKLADAIDPSVAARLAQGWRQVVARADARKAQWLDAQEIVIETALQREAEALAEAQRLLALHAVPREVWELPTLLAPLTVQIGDVVQVQCDHYRFASAPLAVVVGLSENLASKQTGVEVWL